MKNEFLQVRLSPEEKKQIMKKCEASGMSASAFMRSALLGTAVCQTGSAQKAMMHICRMFSILNRLDVPEVDELREELNEVCRALQS